MNSNSSSSSSPGGGPWYKGVLFWMIVLGVSQLGATFIAPYIAHLMGW